MPVLLINLWTNTAYGYILDFQRHLWGVPDLFVQHFIIAQLDAGQCMDSFISMAPFDCCC